ncbi:MAG TPA: LytTR family DNA-binding domain-containing protein [Polyangiaceae bacterium]|jgi:two-component system LytT family response regulator|nr:LytTR family DNA-binding domain-containing protein [Polyangiaceae bacterium]
MDNPKLRVAIIDDEPLAREGIRLLLTGDPEIEVVAESGSGFDAVSVLRRLRPDLVFLDVQMPEMNGFEVMAALAPDEVPAVIFVTAFDRYALRAFEVHALDYLLKPFDDDRFFDAVRRAKDRLRLSRVSDLSQRLISLLATYEGKSATGEARERAARPEGEEGSGPEAEKYLTRIAIKDVGRVVFLSVEEIDWIEAADYYVQIHAGGRSYLHRESMNSLEGRLDPARFMRIHRSAIVNRDRVKELRSHGRRDLVVVLAGGAELKVARSHRDKLQALR